MTVGERIKQKRTELGWSRRRLSDEAGIPYPTLAGLENGDQRGSTAIAAISAALGVDPLWLSDARTSAGHGDAARRTRPVTDIRRFRLQQLCESEGGQAQLARRIDRDRRQVSAWLASAEKPGAKDMSESTARWIEEQCGKPRGWLEHPGDPSASDTADRLKMRSAIDLLKALASLKLAPSDLARDPDAITIAYNFVVAGSHGSDA